MSDDLISRKAVIEAVDRHTREDGTLDDDISVILEEVKTAFDKEKVIAELVNLRQKEYHDDDCEEELLDGEEIYDEGRSQGRFEAYHKAIEIVDKGGIEQ